MWGRRNKTQEHLWLCQHVTATVEAVEWLPLFNPLKHPHVHFYTDEATRDKVLAIGYALKELESKPVCQLGRGTQDR